MVVSLVVDGERKWGVERRTFCVHLVEACVCWTRVNELGGKSSTLNPNVETIMSSRGSTAVAGHY